MLNDRLVLLREKLPPRGSCWHSPVPGWFNLIFFLRNSKSKLETLANTPIAAYYSHKALRLSEFRA